MKVLLCLVALFCAASAHGRCQAPDVWESNIQEYIPKLNVSIPFGRLSYDAENRRTRTVEIILVNGTNKQTLDIIYLQRCKVAFVYNYETKQCTRQKVDIPWKPMTIPADAKYLGDAYAGSAGVPHGGLLLQTWMGNSTEQGGFSYVATYTRHGCLPLSVTMWGGNFGLAVASFYDITLGIANPNVFHPPKECFQQGQVLPEDLVYIQQPVRQPAGQQLKKRISLYRLVQARPTL